MSFGSHCIGQGRSRHYKERERSLHAKIKLSKVYSEKNANFITLCITFI